ncbi:L,D-transpeptidase family protein [Methylocystis parvus]|uniref:L,D-transpeptidase family protein n=1 Tax=Methylocystis parvus TaxID=134 RepID=A0A6B8MD36_9HYPH|nr:L,D-transpeptidase family protein [Methylocystis parvus]QGM99692.1 L,D-transpeptidase family protein [Methylocystis parvus]WBK02040.1 L,D-transpeptidase family protein [Methylocystis parvus OBBP]
MRATNISRLYVARRVGGKPHEARLVAGARVFPCAIGRAGITRDKREGDGATPAGRWRLLRFYLRKPAPLRAPWRLTRGDDIWCDDAGSFLYNRRLRAPSCLSHEDMWRKDRLYDVVGVMDYNLSPRVRGRGSAIFFHIATKTLEPTAGCVALRARDMARLVPRLARGAAIVVG